MFGFQRSTVASPETSTRPRRRWRRWVAGGLILLLLVAFFLPSIVAKSPIFDRILAKATRDLHGSVKVGSVSLGWFSPVELRNVELRDERGAVVVSISSVRGSKSLLNLVRNSRDLGDFHIDGATLNLVTTDHATNLETILATYLSPKKPQIIDAKPGGVPTRLNLTGEKITVNLQEPAVKRQWTVALDQLAFGLNQPTGEALALTLRGSLADPKNPGELKIDLKSLNGTTSGTLASKQIPLAMFEPFLKRADASAVLDGMLDSNLEFALNPNGDGTLIGLVKGNDLILSSSLIQRDLLALNRLEVPCRIRSVDGKLYLDQLALRSEVGTVELSGSFPLNATEDPLMTSENAVLSVDVDLALLARRLPKTVRLQTDTQISSGRLSATLKGVREAERLVWKGDLKTSKLRGKASGRDLVWDQPLAVEFAVKPQKSGLPLIDKLRCQSDFIQVTASSTAESVTVEGRCNLDQFRQRVSQWIDLGALDISGEGTVRLVATKREAEGFQLKGEATFKQSRLLEVNGTRKLEETVRVEINVAGTAPTERPISLTGGGITVQASGDGLGLYILEPIPDLTKLDRGCMRLIMRGQLERWQARLGPWVEPLRELKTNGPLDLTVLAKFEPDGIRFVNVDASLGEPVVGREVRLAGYGIDLLEPTLKLKSSGVLKRSTGKLTLNATDFLTPSLQLKLASIEAGNDPKGVFSIRSSGTMTGDLARLQKWFSSQPIQPQDQVRGVVSGSVDLGIVGGTIKMKADLRGENAMLGIPAAPIWKDSKLTLMGGVELDPRTDTLRLTRVNVQGTGLGFTADGTISNYLTSKEVSLRGELRYDLEKLEPQLRSMLGNQLLVRGNETRAFKVEGSLTSGNVSTLVKLNGEAALGWRELKCFGADIGSTQIPLTLQKGWLVVPAVETSLNRGKLKLLAGMRLDPGPSELMLYPGTTIERAVITPQMCADALGYLMPALAKSTEAEGTFSLSIDAGRVPLNRPESGDISGKLTLHAVQVGPGPMLKELSVLSNNPNSIALAKDQIVPFRMVNGRIYHENLRLSFPELTITTSGSVGIDGTLDLIAEMPIPPKWMGKNAITVSLSKQTIRLPIQGTLANPKLNEQALRNYVGQFAKDAAKDFLKDELEKKFQKLIRP